MGGEFSGERICYMYGWVLLLSTWNYQTLLICYSVHFSRSVVSTLCNPMNRRKPGLPVHHQLPEFTQTHVHRVSDAIQLSHHPSSPYAPDPSPSQYQGLCQWVNSSHHVAKVLEFQLQHHSFQWTPRTGFLGLTGWISLQSKGLARLFSNTTVQKHQFFHAQLSSQSNSHIHTWPLEKPWTWLDRSLLAKYHLCFSICCLNWS